MPSNPMKRPLNRRNFAISTALGASQFSGEVGAQVATPAQDHTQAEFTGEVLLSGLADPRFVIVDGTDIYFTEAGSAGDEPVYATTEEGTP